MREVLVLYYLPGKTLVEGGTFIDNADYAMASLELIIESTKELDGLCLPDGWKLDKITISNGRENDEK